MPLPLLVQGVLLGLAIAAPVGPIGILCIRRTLDDGHGHGLVSGLGAATADAIYGCVAAFGLQAVSQLLVAQQTPLKLAGGCFLVFLGLRSLLSKPAETAAPELQPLSAGLLGAYASTLALTLTNPMTILSFTAMLASLGAGYSSGLGVQLVIGVFAGSALWWLLLSTGTNLIKRRLNAGAMAWVSRLSGIVIAGFGIWAIVSGLS